MTQTPPARATRRDWIGLAIIALPCMVYAMDLTVLNLAVPALSAELQPSNAQLLWIIDIYGFMVAGFLITMGTLGDRIGRRKLLLLGLWLLPEYRDPNAGRLDLWSVALSLAAVLPTTYGVKHAAEHGLSGVAAASIVIGLAMGGLFIRRQSRLA